jgi:DNA mismatch repair protein MSH5
MPAYLVVFRARVTPGLALQSHASICARAAGLPAHVIERANYVTQLAAKHDLARLALEDAQSSDEEEEGAARSARPSRTSSRSVRKAEAVARRFVEWDLETESAGGDGGASRETTLAKLRQVLGGSDDDDI